MKKSKRSYATHHAQINIQILLDDIYKLVTYKSSMSSTEILYICKENKRIHTEREDCSINLHWSQSKSDIEKVFYLLHCD